MRKASVRALAGKGVEVSRDAARVRVALLEILRFAYRIVTKYHGGGREDECCCVLHVLASRGEAISRRLEANMPMAFETPEWVRDAVFYQIFPERFANGDRTNDPPLADPWGSTPRPDGFMGGDLQGILDRLGYLTELGVNALYLNPVFKAPSNHKYDHADYLQIDPHLGSNALMKTLVDACHRRGIRVILDISHNHSGRELFAFADVVTRGADSPYRDWYRFWGFPVSGPERPNYDAWWGLGSLPEFNHENAEVRAYFREVTRYWMEEVGVDGWRLDVANEVPHDYWREWREFVKRINPEAYVVGEIWGDGSPWLAGDNFDAVMNYVWRDYVIAFFVKGTLRASEFDAQVRSLLERHAPQVNRAMFNLLGSHDTARILTVAGGDVERVKLMMTYQMAYVGAPVVYYGDEIGMRGEKDPGCRGAFVWDEGYWNLDLYRHVRHLIHIRHRTPALRSLEYERVLCDDANGLYVFRRGAGAQAVYAVLNSSAAERPLAFCVPEWRHVSEAVELVTNTTVRVWDGMVATVAAPWQGMLIARPEASVAEASRS